ncbi:MAG: ABC transporter ATP-binding protein [Deltaproteobacteria bacterium]|nr:ABC transporter ATP-binding protein [Deltaproteobacteria bacterium]
MEIEIQGLTKSYELDGVPIPVLKGFDLRIGGAELVSLTGPSGVGKSTFLHVLGTLDQPTRGTIRYDGLDVFAQPAWQTADFRNRRIGFVFQFHHLLSEFTALENVMLPALAQRTPRQRAAAMAREVLDLVGLSNRTRHKPGELSGGEQQRVALARALVLGPGLLLADEPTGNLDEKTSEEIHELLFRINRERGVAAVVVTHNTRLAARMPRKLVMLDGKIGEGTYL